MICGGTLNGVLEIYRITLLSNWSGSRIQAARVLEIYRITLLSNSTIGIIAVGIVLEIYRITLLSNGQQLG